MFKSIGRIKEKTYKDWSLSKGLLSSRKRESGYFKNDDRNWQNPDGTIKGKKFYLQKTTIWTCSRT